MLKGMAGAALALHAVRSSAAAPETVTLTTPGGRAINVTRWTPRHRRGTILFSHGALSSPAFYDLFILPWVDAGYEIWAPLHVDSLQHPDRAAFAGLKSWAARLEDMHVLAAHVGQRSVIAVGHSYGGLVALTLGGASPVPPPGYAGPMAEPQVKAAVAFSPPGPMPGLVEPGAYASLAVPALIQSGTADLITPPGTQPDPASWSKHMKAFDECRPGGHRYGLVLEGVDHYFGGTICDFTKPGPPKAEQAGIAARIATEFMDGYGLDSRHARRTLDARLGKPYPVILMTK